MSFSNDPASRKSTKGYLFILFKGPIDWQFTKQKSVMKSSTKIKLLALLHAVTKSIWWQQFSKKIRFDPNKKQIIYCDNLQTI